MFGKLLLERLIRSFLAAFAGTLAIGATNADISSQGLKALAVGAFAAGVSACFTLISQFFGDPDSTSFTSAEVK